MYCPIVVNERQFSHKRRCNQVALIHAGKIELAQAVYWVSALRRMNAV